MDSKIKVSTIIATFNSQKTLPLVLTALRSQNYPKDLLEILIIDGGSTDSTKTIAEQYGAIWINNPRTEPVYAKFLGYRAATGQYCMYLDHDEVLENPSSISNRVNILSSNPSVKAALLSGYKAPPNYPFINSYINEFGDPFSFFIYNLSKDSRFFVRTLKKRYLVEKEDSTSIFINFDKMKRCPIIELCACGSMIDIEYMKNEFPQTLESPELIPHFFYLMLSKVKSIALTKDDSIIHYSAESLRKYLRKISWRIRNNVHFPEMANAGFAGRARYLTSIDRYKKYGFLPYSFSIIAPLIDSIYLAVTRRSIGYLLHVFLCLFTASSITYNLCLKLLRKSPELRSYDGTKTVVRN